MKKNGTTQNLPEYTSYEDGYVHPKASSYKGPQKLSVSVRRNICGFNGYNSNTESTGSYCAQSNKSESKTQKHEGKERDVQADKYEPAAQKQDGAKLSRAAKQEAEAAADRQRQIHRVNALGAMLHANGMHRVSAALEAQRRLGFNLLKLERR